MSLLYDAAVAWSNLQGTSYSFLLGRKGTWSESFVLSFSPEEFPHLAGLQYALDVDFGVNKAEMRGNRLIPKLLSGEIDSKLIEKSTNWQSNILGRLEGIIALEETLDTNFFIYLFNSDKVPHGSRPCLKNQGNCAKSTK